MAQLVNLPDGSQASFPDGTPPDVMKAAIQKRFPPQASSGPPQGAVPGSAEYRDWAVAQAKAGKQLPAIVGSEIPTNEQNYGKALEGVRRADFPQFSPEDFKARVKDRGVYQPLNPQEITQNDQLLGFGDELSGAAQALPQMFMGHDYGQSYDALRKLQLARRDLGIEQSGGLGQAASVLGELTSLGAAAPANVTSQVLSKGQRAFQAGKDIASSGATGAALGGVQGFGSTDGDLGQRLEGAKNGALTGAAVGVAAPVLLGAAGRVATNFANNRAVNTAIKNAPGADDLASVGSALFKASKSAGVGVKPQVFGTFARNLSIDAHAADIDKELDAGAWTVYERMVQLAQEGFADPSALSLSRLHNLRQKAQDVVIEAKKPRTKNFAQNIVDGLDNMIGGLKPSDMTFPANRLGGGSPKDAANALLDGISTWSKAKKASLVETAIKKAQNYPSGVESGLRAQFKTLLNGNKTSKMFTDVERKALQAVVNGTLPITALRTLGIFRGMGGAVLGSLFGGPLGTVVGAAAGIGGRKITEMATEAAANRAAKIVATPHIPLPPPFRPRLTGTTLPLAVTGQQKH